MALGNAIAYSPITNLTNNLLIEETEVTIADIGKLPDTPLYAVLTKSTNPHYANQDLSLYETILINEIDGSTIKQIVRGVEGTEQNWNTGDLIACFFTAAQWNEMKQTVNNKEKLIYRTEIEPVTAQEGDFWLDISDGVFQGTIFDDIMPIGGNTGDALIKSSDNNYDIEWGSVEALPEGGTTGQVLAKVSSTNYDVEWANAGGLNLDGGTPSSNYGGAPVIDAGGV